MSRVVLLDAGPLGMYTNPKATPKNQLCRQRVDDLIRAGAQVKAPRIAVYETRRKLVHLQYRQPAAKILARFDQAVLVLGVVPMTDAVMHRASEIWGKVRHRGWITAPPEALDGDVIVAAMAELEVENGYQVEIATTNSSDLGQVFPHILNWDDLVK
jgi:hypothetical protein